LDFCLLFKLRFVVAALGETHPLGRWTIDVVSDTGQLLLQQGFQGSSAFVQKLAGFRLAHLSRDKDLANPPTLGGCSPNTGPNKRFHRTITSAAELRHAISRLTLIHLPGVAALAPAWLLTAFLCQREHAGWVRQAAVDQLSCRGSF